MVYIAGRSPSQLCGLQEIADKEQIPTAYLGKVLGSLRKHQLLRSEKGIHGGYELALPAEEITVWDIYSVLEPDVAGNECILGLEACNGERKCALHDSWIPVRDRFVDLLKTKTIDQISDLDH